MRRDTIDAAAVGKRVLHLGATEQSPLWRALRMAAKDYTGYSADATEVLVSRDHELRVGDLDMRPIEMVVAENVVERLTEPGRLFEVAAALTGPSARLVVVTPDVSGWRTVALGLLGREPHRDAVCSFSPTTLRSLASRYGWEAVSTVTASGTTLTAEFARAQ